LTIVFNKLNQDMVLCYLKLKINKFHKPMSILNPK